MEPLLLVSAEEHPEHLAGSATVVLACLVPRHAASQGTDRYTACKDGPQKADCVWVTSIRGAACLDQPQVGGIVGCRASRLPEAGPCVRMCRHYPASRWNVHWLRSRIGICRYAMHRPMGGKGRAGPKVSSVRDDEGVKLVLTCARVRLRRWALAPLGRTSAELAPARWGTMDGDPAWDMGRGFRVSTL
jgi:hypothetical protein